MKMAENDLALFDSKAGAKDMPDRKEPDARAAWVAAILPLGAVPGDYDQEMYKSMCENLDNLADQYVLLMGSFYGKGVTKENVKKLFAMSGMKVVPDSVLMAVITYYGMRMVKFQSGDDLLSASKVIPWLKHRLTAHSSGRLVYNFAIARKDFFEKYCGMELDDIAEINEKFWDLSESYKITTAALAATHAYMTVCKTVPEGWYQGEKAKQECGNYMTYVALFKADAEYVRDGAIDAEADLMTNAAGVL
jgi:hypothetical protein